MVTFKLLSAENLKVQALVMAPGQREISNSESCTRETLRLKLQTSMFNSFNTHIDTLMNGRLQMNVELERTTLKENETRSVCNVFIPDHFH